MDEERNPIPAWFTDLKKVAPFIPTTTADEFDLLSCQIVGDFFTVHGCEETLLWSVLVNEQMRVQASSTIGLAARGMRQIARSCLDMRFDVNTNIGWHLYVSGFDDRHSRAPQALSEYPFLRAIVLAARFVVVRRQIGVDLISLKTSTCAAQAECLGQSKGAIEQAASPATLIDVLNGMVNNTATVGLAAIWLDRIASGTF